MLKGLDQVRVSVTTMFGLVLLLTYLQTGAAVYLHDSPVFNTTPEHIKAIEGDRVLLKCRVENLGKYKIIWVNPRKILMSHADSRLIDDSRISVERGHRSVWNLLIRQVRYNDSGTYECRTNTDPIQTKKITLDVRVPPSILDSVSSDDVTVVEGEKITLICNVTGIPPPNVTWWQRVPGEARKKQIGHGGEVLIIHNVTRSCGDTYECRVDNGVEPAVSKAIHVNVEFPPEVVVPRPMRIGQVAGRETILECTIYAEPQGMTAWRRNGRILRDGPKYEADMMEDVVNKAVILTLRIRELEEDDFGIYQCTGSNYLGSDEEDMLVYRIEPPPPSTTTTTTTSTTVHVPVIHGGRDNNVAYTGDGRNRYEDPYSGREEGESSYQDKNNMGRQGNLASSSHQEGKPSRSKGEDDTWSVFGPKDASAQWAPQKWILAFLTALSFTASCLLF